MLPSHTVMALITALIVFLEWGSTRLLSNFAARKLCHAGCGAGIMLLDSASLECRLCVWAVAGSSIAMTWGVSPLPSFRFSSPRDVGVTVYLCLVSAWFFLQLPAPILAPLFFACSGQVVPPPPRPRDAASNVASTALPGAVTRSHRKK